MPNTTHTVRISCACKLCADLAAKLGLPLPLAAFIRPETAATLGITDERSAKAAKRTHGSVYVAHAPTTAAAQNIAVADR